MVVGEGRTGERGRGSGAVVVGGTTKCTVVAWEEEEGGRSGRREGEEAEGGRGERRVGEVVDGRPPSSDDRTTDACGVVAEAEGWW